MTPKEKKERGRRVADAIDHAGFTQEDFAEEILGIKQGSLSSILGGRSTGEKHLSEIARNTNVSYEWLSDASGVPPPWALEKSPVIVQEINSSLAAENARLRAENACLKNENTQLKVENIKLKGNPSVDIHEPVTSQTVAMTPEDVGMIGPEDDVRVEPVPGSVSLHGEDPHPSPRRRRKKRGGV